MIRLLIAEDEKIVRETISQVIDWNAYDIDLVAVCKDGLEAYDTILDEYPDIVLTDIRMPGLTGLELIERAQELEFPIEFIILSGYGEFEYAKSAMKYGVRDYLLKPADENQILEAVLAVKETILARQQAQQDKALRQHELFESIIKRQLTVEAITAGNDLQHLLRRYQPEGYFPQGQYYTYYISFLPEEEFSDFVLRLTPLKQIFHFSFVLNILYVINTAICMIHMNESSNKQGFDQALEQLTKDSSSGLTWWAEEGTSLSDMLLEVNRKVRRYDRILLMDNNFQTQEIYNYVSAFQETGDTLTALQTATSDPQREMILSQLFENITDLELARMLSMRIVGNCPLEESSLDSIQLGKFFQELYGLEDVFSIYRLTLQLVLAALSTADTTEEYSAIVSETLRYGKEHLDDPRLSLKWLAENKLYVSVDHLSRQFTRQTGQRFSDYLNGLRIAKAKELIVQSRYEHIYEIAEQVGTGNNPQYFSQLFKKHTGLTPSEYRAKYRPH